MKGAATLEYNSKDNTILVRHKKATRGNDIYYYIPAFDVVTTGQDNAFLLCKAGLKVLSCIAKDADNARRKFEAKTTVYSFKNDSLKQDIEKLMRMNEQFSDDIILNCQKAINIWQWDIELKNK